MMKHFLHVDPGFLLTLCKPMDRPRYYKVTKNHLPDDAEVVGTGLVDHPGHGLSMVVLEIESKEFGPNTPQVLPPVEFTEILMEER